jgi:uncharacterized protein (TIGR03435 family)
MNSEAYRAWGFHLRLSLQSGIWKWQRGAVSLGVVTAILNVAPGNAQSPAARPEFEVASIKLNTGGGTAAYIRAQPGRLVMTNFSVRQLILSAHGVQDYQITGEPSWTGSDRYDIEAKAEGNPPVNQMTGPMLQTLLEDRCKLKLHRETRQLPVYELTVAKSGVKLQQTKEGGCTPYSVNSPPPPSPAPGTPRPTFCGFPRLGVSGLNRTLDGAGVSIPVLATNLSRSELRRMIIDKTGLTGTFDVHLKWSIDTTTGIAGLGGPDASGAVTAPESLTGPSIFTALQEQLGLKLESTKGPVEVLVIDRVEKPSSN